jgi:hypothetical protein
MFIKCDNRFLTVPLLKHLCKSKSIKYSKLNKDQLIYQCNKLNAVKCIQRCFRNYFYRNAVDNITLESVKYPCFIYRVKTGKIFFYEYNSIIKYIMKSGKVIDPNTRNAYTDLELLRLDTEAKIHCPDSNFKSTLKIKNNEAYARRIKNRENAVMALELRLNELKDLLLNIVESNMLEWENPNEPIVIENIEYHGIHGYVNSVLHDLRSLFSHLKEYSQFEANCFKTTLLELIPNTHTLYNKINAF